ncbi:PKD domain-containing protein [Amycolatopsis palatopharyngis]|uniref:PKD domain-containing protein n=1 Tax=Amycolatopsis palatopharyngis TaxID=187982 RepID=UPI000E23091F|nr:PKD domain-containing protein [Amycolatopsis palatopharyngis]
MALAALLVPAAAVAAPATQEQATVTLLSHGAAADGSATYAPELTGADRAVDGDVDTMWISKPHTDSQWLDVDLGAPALIDRVQVEWGSDHATDYVIQTSPDGKEWRTAHSVRGSNGSIDHIRNLSATGRYLRMRIDRASENGYSVRELEVYGDLTGPGDTEPPDIPGGLRVTGTSSEEVVLEWAAAADNAAVAGYEVLRNGDVVATTGISTFSDGPLVSSVGFDYQVRAVDSAGNLSNPSAPVRAATEPGAGTAATTLAVGGDIAVDCTASDSNCVHARTATMIEQMNPDGVLTLGDNQYESGTLRDYEAYYDTTWGRFLQKTYPTPGNHEYYTDAVGYKQYYGSRATPDGKTYYSFDLGGWHFVALDSNLEIGQGSAQLAWLQDDLAANSSSCTAAFYHHPRFSSGAHGDNRDLYDVWQVFDEAGGDVTFAGHDHHYERFAPVTADGQQTPDGVRSAIVGTGGRGLYNIGGPHDFTEKLIGDRHGVMQLSVTETTYQWDFIGVDGDVLDSTPTYQCHGSGDPEPGQPTAEFTEQCSAEQPVCDFDANASTDPDGQITDYSWDFGDGETATGVRPSHTYAQAGKYPVTLTVTDNDGKTDAHTREVTAGAPPAGEKPTASFTVECGFGSGCTFDGSGSTDDGGIAGYAWDFGDGATASGVTTTHTYTSAGTFTATLTVTDDAGQTGSATRQLQCFDFSGSAFCFPN